MSTGPGVTIPVQRGRPFSERVELQGRNSRPITGLLGNEALSGVVWAGDDRAPLFTPTVTWFPSSTTDVVIAGTGVQTDVEPASYPIEVTVGTSTAVVAWLVVSARPAAAPAPKTYCSLDHLYLYGGPWLRQLQTRADQAGFAEQRGRARSMIDDWILDRICVGLPIGSSSYTTARSAFKAYLDADGLKIGGVIPDRIVEVAARLALAIILDGQLGEKDPTAYQSLAKAQREMAWDLWRSSVVLVDTNGDGVPDLPISMAATAIRLERG